MKKIFMQLFLFTMASFVMACSDDNNDPTLSFSRAIYVLPADAPLDVEVRLSGPALENLVIPFQVAGSAVEGEDYEIPVKEFVVPAGADRAQVQIVPKDNYIKKREIRLELQAVPGYRLWNNRVAMIPLETKDYLICTFETENLVLTERLGVIIKVSGVENESYVPSSDVHIPFEINPKLSTAAAGEHFSVEGDVTEFVISAGTDRDTVYFNYLALDAARNRIVLDLKPDASIMKGNYIRANIKVSGPPRFDKLVGKWSFLEVRSFDWIKSLTEYDYPDDAKNLPVNNLATDVLEFIQGETDVLKTRITGDLAKYFRDCDVEFLGEEPAMLVESSWETVMIPYFTLSKVNVSFSDKNINERPAKVGFRVIENGQILEVSIYDYVPTDFLSQVYEFYLQMGMNLGEMCTLRYHFKKVE